MRRATENPMEAIADMLAFNSRDWSEDTADVSIHRGSASRIWWTPRERPTDQRARMAEGRVVGRQRQEGPLMYNDDKDPDQPAPPPNTPERWTFDAACQCDDTYGDYPWCPACYPEASA